ncbi:hypothetical protein PF005_g9343 [Phytophthora fragariae]|uniref:Uncharacterized protein n=1 Tax=Phytophthora fragariae TaxID=53985 RepID=A0A6A3ZWT0_9STRA|nr:hypothetical protein PF003_g724 [Phytophthora fragariae]KAE9018450.1 hypothetical protein PF011_g6253 [Phytophthora fragariae]KAE9215664.1 hypothetical protein PF005_g9343 [Phytophthora fragariae]KAE9242915.1 hypothetical protein PF002_g8504 [Phytophthora fragariae]KAE9317709.1 hypothetical protein PF001_g6722 [Phytophthora fragariae]
MALNQYEDKEVHTPAGTPVVQDAHYHDETALRLDVTVPEAENKKDDEDIPLDKNGRPMVKFFRWRMSLLKINYMDVTSIPSDTEIDVTFSVNLQYDVPVSATTDPVTTSLIYDGVTFGIAGVVGQHIKSGRNRVNHHVSENRRGLPFNNIKFERTLSPVGFNNFADVDPEVQHIDLWGCSDGVYEMDVNASINNPSAMGLQGIGALNMSVYYNNSYLGYAYSEKSELGMPRGLNNQSFRVVMFEDSPALEGVITGFLGAGGVTVSVRGDNPYSTEYTQFKEAMSKVNMTVEYDDGLDKVSFNTSCVSSFLTVLGY